MKNLCLLSLAALFTFALFGCSALDNPVGHSAVTGDGQTLRPGQALQQTLTSPGFLYYPDGDVRKGSLADTALVTPEHGGHLKAEFEYLTRDGEKLHVNADLHIDPASVVSDVVVTMTLDTNFAGVRFSPEGLVFARPAKLDFHVNHMGALDEGTAVGFFYVDDAGNFTPVAYDGLDVHTHPDHCDLGLRHAYLPHFSIYAFGR